jgi:hypothetical protein
VRGEADSIVTVEFKLDRNEIIPCELWTGDHPFSPRLILGSGLTVQCTAVREYRARAWTGG